MASVGRIEPYDGNCDLEAYLERLELYFIANNLVLFRATITKPPGG